jgi:hypothetical protein
MALTRCIAAGILLFGSLTAAHSMPMHVPDQVSDPVIPEPFRMSPPSAPFFSFWQQGVTAGASGTLTQVDIFYAELEPPPPPGPPSPPEMVQFSLRSGVPEGVGPVLFNQVLNFTNMQAGGPIEIDVSSKNILVDIGTQFVIGLRQLTPSMFFNPGFIGDQSGNVYLGGSLWFQGVSSGPNGNGGTDLMNLQTSDLQFTTYVGGSQSIPEPAALTLLLIGILGISLARTRRHQGPVGIAH